MLLNDTDCMAPAAGRYLDAEPRKRFVSVGVDSLPEREQIAVAARESLMSKGCRQTRGPMLLVLP